MNDEQRQKELFDIKTANPVSDSEGGEGDNEGDNEENDYGTYQELLLKAKYYEREKAYLKASDAYSTIREILEDLIEDNKKDYETIKKRLGGIYKNTILNYASANG